MVYRLHNEYIRYVDNYFPNAEPVVDSFHVIQWIRAELEQYIRDLQKNFERRDEERQQKVPRDGFGRQRKLPMSDEVYLLKNYRFFLLSNEADIIRHEESHMDRHFRYYMNTAEYERRFFDVDPRLKRLRYLKNLYTDFNSRNSGKPQKASLELDQLIEEYRTSGDEIFERFSRLLKRYRQPIINSFILFERLKPDGNVMVSRLSNGPMESMNRQIKDLRRLAHGFRSFDHLRNRFLFATRNAPALNGKLNTTTRTEQAFRFRNTVPKDRQRRLRQEYEVMREKHLELSKDELLALKHWIAEGNSPFSNPDGICDKYGVITDFITASRILDEAFKN